MKRTVLSCIACLATAGLPFSAEAGADDDWAIIEELDKGPSSMPASRDEALRLAKAHFAKHRAAIDAFIAAYPDDPRVLDARLRIISIRAALGGMEKKPTEIRAALEDLMALEKSSKVPPARLPDIAFRRISMQMQTMEGTDAQIREAVVVAARNFAARFPTDKRAPRLLVEAATQFDEDPRTMKDLLTSARNLSSEPELNARIDDDLRRLNALNAPVEVRFTTIQGGSFDSKRFRGKIVVILFWAAESPHSLLWMQKFVSSMKQLSSANVEIVTVSLDENRAALDEAMRNFEIKWPTHFDGKGWENSVARPLGINAIPTVWIIDRKGVLRALNARENYEAWLRKLIQER